MSPTENPEGLLAQTRKLVQQVEQVDKHLAVAQAQAHRTRVLTVVTLVLTVLSIAGVVLAGMAVRSNHQNSVVACENANESRKANLTLWTFVLSASAASNPNPTPAQEKLRKAFEGWVKGLYAPRDCSDLSKKVEIPPPPSI